MKTPESLPPVSSKKLNTNRFNNSTLLNISFFSFQEVNEIEGQNEKAESEIKKLSDSLKELKDILQSHVCQSDGQEYSKGSCSKDNINNNIESNQKDNKPSTSTSCIHENITVKPEPV